MRCTGAASVGKGTVVMEDIAFNQCVSLTEFTRDRYVVVSVYT
jgi:hypothetical protein